jgi:lambda family phage minor tail protein L
VADANDAATSDSTKDVCGKRLTSCKLRFGQNNPLPYGGFPAAALTR